VSYLKMGERSAMSIRRIGKLEMGLDDKKAATEVRLVGSGSKNFH